MVNLNIAKKHIESLYFGTFTAIQRIKQKNEETKITEFIEEEYIIDQPCKLSFKNFTSTTVDGNAKSSLTTKLFFPPEIELKEGSKLIVKQNNKEYILSNSGVVRNGINHNEVEVINFDKWV